MEWLEGWAGGDVFSRFHAEAGIEAVDTTTSAGRMLMQMLGSFAEFERSMVRERTA